jgi:hypothetical protein
MVTCTLLLILQLLQHNLATKQVDIIRNVSEDNAVLEGHTSCDPVYLMTYPEKAQRCPVIL